MDVPALGLGQTLLPEHGTITTDAPDQSSGGNTLPPSCHAAGFAQLLCQHQIEAVSTLVRGMPR